MGKELEEARDAKAKVEQRLATLEDEMKRLEGQHLREVELKDNEVKDLTRCCSEQSSYIEELRGRVQILEKELADSHKRLADMDEEVATAMETEKEAQKEAQSQRWNSDILMLQLEMAQADHQKAKTDADLVLDRLNYLESAQGKNEVVEAYRQSPDGKLELALGVKAGFDFLTSLLPAEAQPNDDNSYPSLVYDRIHILRSLEAQGAIIPLEPVSEGDKENEEDEEETGAAPQPPVEAVVDVPPVGDGGAISQPSEEAGAGVASPPPNPQ